MTPETLQACLSYHFGDIEDPRVERTRAHQLLDIIAIALLAVLCGANSWVAISTYGKAKQSWLSTFLALPNGIPSHDTFARVFARLDPAALETSFQQWVQTVVASLDAQVIAIDGKGVNGSYDREHGVRALQMVSAWASAHRLVLAQCPVATKSNEITAIPRLLQQLTLTGSIVSIDAMGTQTAIARQIRHQNADYILGLKGNQRSGLTQARKWFEQIDTTADSPSDITYHQQTTHGHHRIETRRIWQVPAQHVFTAAYCAKWSGLHSVVVVHSHRRLWNQETDEVRFFLSSLAVDAAAFAGYIRAHWGIENQLHWCLDVVFGEDASRIRKGHAPCNMSLLRRFALNLLRRDPSSGSLAMKRYRAGLDDGFLVQVLQNALQHPTPQDGSIF